MNATPSPQKRHRIRFDVESGFETKVRLLAAKWGVKTNVAIQRAVDLALTRPRSVDEKVLLQTMAADLKDLRDLLIPS